MHIQLVRTHLKVTMSPTSLSAMKKVQSLFSLIPMRVAKNKHKTKEQAY